MKMPFYRVSEMAESRVAAQPMGRFKGLAGELMKVGFVTYPKGKVSRPHYHPNEEQFLLILEGRQWMIVGDEERLIGPGDLVHIPRGAKHGGVIIDEEFRMFTAKSPSGDGRLDQEGATPHFHPNEEQFILVLKGRRYVIVGDEERVVEPGDLVHIPRNTRHGGRTISDKAVFFAAKSPCGDGDLAQDYNEAPDAAEVIERLEEKLDELSG